MSIINSLSDEKCRTSIQKGIDLVDNYHNLVVEEEFEYFTKPDFVSAPSKIKCIFGSMDINSSKIETIGVSQEYIFKNNLHIFKHLVLDKNHDLTSHPNGFEFEEIRQADFESQVFHLKINPFYKPLTAPSFMKKHMTHKYPMSAIVATTDVVNKPLKAGESTSSNYCYVFLNVETGPKFFGFGPGKFGSAFKHYALEDVDEYHQKLTLTALITPRSDKVLNILGFDPIYSTFKFIDLISFKRFNFFRNWKTKCELFMMKHHVRVHEIMLEQLFKLSEVKLIQ